jgi:hypothetical protein
VFSEAEIPVSRFVVLGTLTILRMFEYSFAFGNSLLTGYEDYIPYFSGFHITRKCSNCIPSTFLQTIAVCCNSLATRDPLSEGQCSSLKTSINDD